MPRKTGLDFLHDIFKSIFLNENIQISIGISLKFVHKFPIDNKPTLVQIMAWHLTGDKSLSEPMMTFFTEAYTVERPNGRAMGCFFEYSWENWPRYNGTALYIWVTWPGWVNLYPYVCPGWEPLIAQRRKTLSRGRVRVHNAPNSCSPWSKRSQTDTHRDDGNSASASWQWVKLQNQLLKNHLRNYRKTSSISRTKFQNSNVSCILLQLSSLNPLKPDVKWRMKM